MLIAWLAVVMAIAALLLMYLVFFVLVRLHKRETLKAFDAAVKAINERKTMKFTVTGTTQIGWTVLVDAASETEAEEKAKQYWEHNTTYEDVQVEDVFEGE